MTINELFYLSAGNFGLADEERGVAETLRRVLRRLVERIVDALEPRVVEDHRTRNPCKIVVVTVRVLTCGRRNGSGTLAMTGTPDSYLARIVPTLRAIPPALGPGSELRVEFEATNRASYVRTGPGGISPVGG